MTQPTDPTTPPAHKRLSNLDSLAAILDISALIGASVTVFLTVLKEPAKEIEEEIEDTVPPNSNVVVISYIAAHLLFIGPNFIAWSVPPEMQSHVTANLVITGIHFLKTVADQFASHKKWKTLISPVSECLINAAWLIVAAHQWDQTADKTDDVNTAFAGNVFFDVGGIIAPLTSKEVFGEVGVGFFVAQQLFSLVYGVLSFSTGLIFSKRMTK